MQDESKQLAVILLIIFIGFVGTSLTYPIFPPLFLHPVPNTLIPVSWSYSVRSILLGFALAAYPLGQFFGSPILGAFSDRYGRKKLLNISLIFCIIGYLLSAIALQFHLIGTLLFSRFLTGFMEGNLSIVRAMAADLQTISKYKSFGRINFIASIGYIMGPLLGGVLSDTTVVPWFSYSFPFFVATGFSLIAWILSMLMLYSSELKNSYPPLSIFAQLNLFRRIKLLLKENHQLRFLLIVVSIFTFAVDIFYEFGPVYLTGLWQLTPSGIALYNGLLCVGLGIGSNAYGLFLKNYFTVEKSIALTITLTGVFLSVMILFPQTKLVFFIFGLLGIVIAIAHTALTIEVSNAAHHTVQGEALGTQQSLRMLGDAFICFFGGFLIISSVYLPIAIGALVAFIAAGIFVRVMKDAM